MTFLAIDIGNTRLKWAQYDAPHPGAQLLAHGAEFLENIDKLADGPWAPLATPATMLGCVVAGDAARRRVEEQMELWDVEPRWVVASESEAGLRNGYDFPTRLGADRWVAMIGAWHRMLAQGPARPTIVAMVGTAVTVEAIDDSGPAARVRFTDGSAGEYDLVVGADGIRSRVEIIEGSRTFVELVAEDEDEIS